MKAVILAGGSGTRLWPLSRKNYPKQFLKLNRCHDNSPCAFDRGSLIQQTAARLLKVVRPEDIVIMTGEGYRFHVKADLDAVSQELARHLILEPAGRNTAPAIALAIAYCADKLGCAGDEVVFVSPSDHLIEPDETYMQCLKEAESIATEGWIVTFGITPRHAETGYGYIKIDKTKQPIPSGCKDAASYAVERFTEKPDSETAARYLEEGGYLWNAGMFAFRIDTMAEEMRKHAPDIFSMYSTGYDRMISTFGKMPDISIDYAVMEKTDKAVTLPMDLYWNDVGSWDSIFTVLPKDGDGNVKVGDVITTHTKDSLIMSDKRLIATVGIENLLVVETDDALLVAKRGDAQQVKEIVDLLKGTGRREASEHTTTYRPWGSYTVLEEGPRYKIKRIVIDRNAKLSLQMHHHRSEHWVVTKGTAKVTVGDDVKFVHENESIYIPKSTRHRLENPGKIPLEIIEVQNGEYVEEDDIVRIDDVYGR